MSGGYNYLRDEDEVMETVPQSGPGRTSSLASLLTLCLWMDMTGGRGMRW